MTENDLFAAWKALNDDILRMVWENRAAILPIYEEIIRTENPLSPGQHEIIKRIRPHIWNRIDRRLE